MCAFEGGRTQMIFVQRVDPGNQVGMRKNGIGPSIVRIESDGAFKETARFIEVGRRVGRRQNCAVDGRSAHEKIMRSPGRRRLQQRALGLGLVDMSHQDRGDRPGNFVLDRKDVLQLAVVRSRR